MAISLLINEEPLIPGQTVRGTLSVSSFPQVSGIYLQFRGYERIRFRQRADGENQSCKAVECSDMTVNTGIPTILPISQPHFLQKLLTSIKIPIHIGSKNQNYFSFEFKLDGKLPPTTNFSCGSLKYSAEIEYEIVAQVYCKNCDNLTLTKPVKLMNLMRKNTLPSFLEQELELKASLKSCLFGFCRPKIKGIEQIHLYADWKRNNFTAGDTVDFTIKLSEGLLTVKLVRELFLIIDDRNSFRAIEPIAKSKHGFNMTQLQLIIPPNLEATVRTKAIDCRYFFVFEIKLKGHETFLTTSEVRVY